MKNVLAVTSGIAMLSLSVLSPAKSTIGGIVFTNSYYQDVDDGANSVASTRIDIANNSRLRVRWSNEDNVGMYIESGIGDSVSLRHAYGTWQIDERWQLLAGKTSTPFAPLDPSVAMVRNSGQSVGNVSPGRQSQIRLTYRLQNRRGAFAIALLDPNSGDVLIDPVDGGEIGVRSSLLPRIDIGGAYNAYNWQIFPSAFYHDQQYDDVVVEGSDEDLAIWGVALGMRRGFGAWVLSVEAGTGKNWGNTQMSRTGSPAGDNAGAIVFRNNDVNNIAESDNQNAWIDLGYRFTAGQSKGVVHFIAGQTYSEVSSLGDEYTSSMIGISAPIDLPWIARGFRMRPEIFYFDLGDDNQFSFFDDASGERIVEEIDSGSQFIVGVQLQYTF